MSGGKIRPPFGMTAGAGGASVSAARRGACVRLSLSELVGAVALSPGAARGLAVGRGSVVLAGLPKTRVRSRLGAKQPPLVGLKHGYKCKSA